MKNFFRKALYSTVTAVLLCSIPALFIAVSGRSATHQEANCFLIVYNLDLPLLKLIFDPLRTDWQCFQARELSYLIDFADARFIAACIRCGMAHFFSLSSIIFAISGAGILHRKLKSFYPESEWFCYLLPALLYSFCCCCYFTFFRSSKPAAAFGTLITILYLAEIIRFPEKMNSLRRHIFPGITILLMPYLDRQGFFAVFCCAAGATALLFSSIFPPTRIFFALPESIKKPLTGAAALTVTSVLLSILYNFVIAPEIVFALHGYYPSFAYQRIPRPSPVIITDSICFIFGNIGHIFTALTEDAGLLIGLLMTVLIFFCARSTGNARRITLAALAGIFAAIFCASAAMITRHPALMRPDVMYGNYFQCFSAALCVMCSLIMLDMPPGKTCRTTLLLLFALAVCCRIISFAGIRLTSSTHRSHLAFHVATTPKTIELLNDPEAKIDQPLPYSSLQLIYFFRNHPQLLDFSTTPKITDYGASQ